MVLGVPERPIVMPTQFDNETESTCRKIRPSGPSLPHGSLVWVEVNGRWLHATVQRLEFAVVYLKAPTEAQRLSPGDDTDGGGRLAPEVLQLAHEA
jgi:hypothetical protein